MRMQDLKLGDSVLTKGRKFSKVYAFLHRDESVESNFIRIYAGIPGAPPLEVTADHYIFVGTAVKEAAKVKVGDVLNNGSEGVVVTSVSVIRRRGIYAPATRDGEIVVSGILASNYVSILDTSLLDQHRASHTIMAPLRWYCSALSENGVCPNESFDKPGQSWFLYPLARLAIWISTSTSIHLQVAVSVGLAPLIGALYVMDSVVVTPYLAVAMFVLGLFILAVEVLRTGKKVLRWV